MLEHLASVNLIGRGFSLNNLDQVARGADEIIERAEEMSKRESDALGIPAGQRGAFDAYVEELLARARALRSQAKKGKSEKAAVEYRKLIEGGCLPCHQVFRDQKGKLPRVVHLMTTLGYSLEEIDRQAGGSHQKAEGCRLRRRDILRLFPFPFPFPFLFLFFSPAFVKNNR